MNILDEYGLYRVFKRRGNDEEMEKLNQLLNEKNITREDLILILKCLVLKYHNL